MSRLLLLFTAILYASAPLVVWKLSGSIPEFLLHENGLYETLGFVACLSASVLMLLAFRSERNPFFLIFVAISFFIGMEEISWGDHIFNFSDDLDLKVNNFQGEFNLHNSTLIQDENNFLSSLAFKLLLFFFVIFPLLVDYLPFLGRVVKKFKIPHPDSAFVIYALIFKSFDIFMYQMIYGGKCVDDVLRIGEMCESGLEILIFGLAMKIFLEKRTVSMGGGKYEGPV